MGQLGCLGYVGSLGRCNATRFQRRVGHKRGVGDLRSVLAGARDCWREVTSVRLRKAGLEQQLLLDTQQKSRPGGTGTAVLIGTTVMESRTASDLQMASRPLFNPPLGAMKNVLAPSEKTESTFSVFF